jgi:hypothetical protein
VTAVGRPRIGVLAAALVARSLQLADEYDVVLCEGPPDPGLPAPCVAVDDPGAAIAELDAAIDRNPQAAASLIEVLRGGPQLSVHDALLAESLAYSSLLAGPEFATWLAARDRRPIADDVGDVVLIDRVDDVLTLTLNRPARHNAYNRVLRDQLCDALDIALLDDSITGVVLRGAGPSFCSGGDLDEFGASADVTTAHLVRLDRSVAARLERCRDRVHVTVHGACIGAGIEIPSFAARVTARPGAFFQLPELAMGLVPGAGGTVGITRRIGRWRTAYLALTGTRLDRETALAWGLVDD